MYKLICKYGFFGSINILKCIIYTKLFFPNARLIRLPFDIRNKKYIKIGDNFTSGRNCRIEALPFSKSIKKCIEIGNNVQINDNVHIGAVCSIKIGNNVLIASRVFISDHNHGNYNNKVAFEYNIAPADRKISYEKINIEDNVWIGEGVCILKGVTIGRGSIIGANSVVTKNISDYSIAVGIPARVIKYYDFNENKWINS